MYNHNEGESIISDANVVWCSVAWWVVHFKCRDSQYESMMNHDTKYLHLNSCVKHVLKMTEKIT